MKRAASRKLALRSEQLRRIEPAEVNGGVTTFTDTHEACSGPCCTLVTVSWCAGKGGA